MADKKTGYNGYTDARRKANAKYNAQFVEIKVRVPAERRNKIKDHAESTGESVNGFINRAIDETMARDSSETVIN